MSWRCPPGRKTDADATLRIGLTIRSIFLTKPLRVQLRWLRGGSATHGGAALLPAIHICPLVTSTRYSQWLPGKLSLPFAHRALKNERPARGDNRAGQAIPGAGVDGRSRRIQPRWGGITAPTQLSRGDLAE